MLAANAELKEQLENAQTAGQAQPGNDEEDGAILRPKGNAGQHFSIQVAMGLASSTTKTEIYKGLQVSVAGVTVSLSSPTSARSAIFGTLLYVLE